MLQCKDCSEWYHLRCEGKLFNLNFLPYGSLVPVRAVRLLDNVLLHFISLSDMVPVLFGENDCAQYIC
jgi:hypothetical protein